MTINSENNRNVAEASEMFELRAKVRACAEAAYRACADAAEDGDLSTARLWARRAERYAAAATILKDAG